MDCIRSSKTYNRKGSGVEPVLLYGILPFGIKISDERINDHKNLFAVSFWHFRNFLHAAECVYLSEKIH
jgi:hypothetical protein